MKTSSRRLPELTACAKAGRRGLGLASFSAITGVSYGSMGAGFVAARRRRHCEGAEEEKAARIWAAATG